MAVVGAGVVGCAAARALALRGERVLVLEKERGPALHQSGRNSGVLHAGFSYKPGSLKARFAVEGSRALRAYARERGVPMQEVGKLVVARRDADAATLERFLVQGSANGVRGLRILDDKGLREVEPEAAGLGALHSPESAIVDSAAYVRALVRDARGAGAEFRFRARLLAARRQDGWRLRTRDGWAEAERLLTCAGLQSDRVARMCGLAHPYRVVPFRGAFWRLRQGRERLVRGLLYPVPDPRFPFVGVHFTKRTDGGVLVGPTALLALGREAYRHWLQPHGRDLASMASSRGFWRMLARRDVRAQARAEVGRALRPRRVVAEAQALVPGVGPRDLLPSPSGIRAQLVAPDGALVDDLVVEERPGAVHVLNAVSPALTASLPFAEHLAERVRAA